MKRLLLPGLWGVLAIFLTSASGQTLVDTNAPWRWRRGTNEASSPVSAWRARTYNDSLWAQAPAPFYYHDTGQLTGNTWLPEMKTNYTCIFMRRGFGVTNAANIASLTLTVRIDDGFIAWINGTEVQRFNVYDGEPVYTNGTPTAINAQWQVYSLTNPSSYLVSGSNVLAIQAFNRNTASSDFIIDAQLIAALGDSTPPVIVSKTPAPGPVGSLTQISVDFSEPVTGVNFSDLLLNGISAIALTGSGASYTFTVEQPPPGTVQVTWAPESGITDLSGNAFNRTNSGATWQYQLSDSVPPTMLSRSPPPNISVVSLSQVQVTFSEPVAGVDASDLRINGIAATNLTGAQAGPYTFSFAPPAPGLVQIAWAAGHGITDQAAVPNAFAGGSWTVLLDPALSTHSIRISEFLAANAGGILDEDDEASDWIELENVGTQTISLAGWSLSDLETFPDQWVFPDVQLSPGQFLVVFASGKDRRPTAPGTRLHTNFRLGSTGEFLGLFAPGAPPAPASVFSPHFPDQRTDVSYGYDSTGSLRYFRPPTPNAANGISSITGVVSPVTANVGRGVFNHPFTLILGTPTPGAVIRYTLDGSEPTLSNGQTYSDPVLIDTTRTLRAAAFADNLLPSRPVTHTYIFPDQVVSQPAYPAGFPATWGSWSLVDYEMDPEVYYDGRFQSNILATLQSFPTLSLVMNVQDMFGGQGIYSNPTWETPTYPVSAVEKPCSAELIYPDGRRGFQIDCGVRVQGGASRTPSNNPKHSLRLMFKNDYGPGRLEFPIFPDSSVSSFNSLILRGEYNNSWIHWDPTQRSQGTNVRDQWGRSCQTALSGIGSHGTYVHLYINGLYWGLYNPSERPDAAFAASYLGGAPEEYDAIKQPVVAVDGDLVAWNAMMSIVRSGLSNNVTYQSLQQYLDVAEFADYMILNIFGGNADWPANNWAAIRRRAVGAQFKFVCWDIERTLESPTRITEFTVGNANSPAEIYAALRQNAEFRLLFADRLHRHFFNGGALTVSANTNRYLEIARQVDQAVQAESARWGDYRRDVHVRGTAYLYNYSDHWLPELNRLLGVYFPQRSSLVISQFQTISLYPTVVAPAFNQHGGRVPPNFLLTISAPAGSIYYTTNGTDPRVYGTGAVSASARLYSGPVTLGNSMTVKARVYTGSTWSALNQADFLVGQVGIPLRITEIMYNPLPGGTAGEAFEFIEFQNVGATTLDLTGFSLEGVTAAFPAGYQLGPGAIFVMASDKNPAGFAARYPGLTVAGTFSGNLSNGGERIAVLDGAGNTITSVDYDDENGWPVAADGFGPSLELLDPNGDPDDPANWRASATVNGNPGTVSPLPAIPTVRLNELMAENLGAVTNAGTFPDWVELYNSGASTAYITNWSLSDDGNPRKFVFPAGTAIPAGGHLVVWLDTATALPGLHAGFALNRTGEALYLFDANTNRVDGVTFGPQLANYTLARLGAAWALGNPTPGATNTLAATTSATNLFINEWLANPAPGAEDWLELFNRASLPVSLKGLHLGTSNEVYRLSALSFLAPGAFLRLWADKLPGPEHLDLKLPAEGGRLLLLDESGLNLQSVDYGPQNEGVSAGRLPDGTASFASFPGSASPGASNYVISYVGPRLNEVLARNTRVVTNLAGHYADWIELWNPSSTPFDLSGLSLSIGSRTPGQWVFPAGSSISSNGFLVVWCDPDAPVSTNLASMLNTGRTIDNDSSAVYLFDASGRQLDSVEFGFQVRDQSLGRFGDTWDLLPEPTPGAPNSSAATCAAPEALRINEWMASPSSGEDWFELYNTSELPVALSGLFLTDDPSIYGQRQFTAAQFSFIGPRDFVQWKADGSPSQGRNHVNFSLDADGDMIGLYGTNLSLLDAVYFGPQVAGVSQGRFRDGEAAIVSFPGTATPASANLRALDQVGINEVLTHTDPPLEDAIELLNLTGTNVAISGWFLSDDPAQPKKYRIPENTVLGPHGFRVFYEVDFNGTAANALVPFALSSARGDAVCLSAADDLGELTGYRALVEFGPAANGISFGRHLTSVGPDFTVLNARTFGVDNPDSLAHFRQGTGAPNAAPLVGPVLISEIMYAPSGDLDQGTAVNAEFIELYNAGAQPVPLYDPAHATNSWEMQTGVGFTFASGFLLPPRGYVLLVGFDPATNAAVLNAFRNLYSLPDTIPVLGPFSGRLDNAGESLTLVRPDNPEGPGPDQGLVPMIRVDQVNYAPAAPWPPLAPNGIGQSLQRISSTAYGNDPVSWFADAPSAGRANLPAQLDTDNDGMPDWWELDHGFNPNNPMDASQDADADRLSNLLEFSSGTDPRDASSTLAITSVELSSARTQVSLRFIARPGKAYTVQYRDSLGAGVWTKLQDVPMEWTTREVGVVDSALPPNGQRFYRLCTPPLP